MSAKNRVKIRSLAPNLGLMSAQKKGIYLCKIGKSILAYYRGDTTPAHPHPLGAHGVVQCRTPHPRACLPRLVRWVCHGKVGIVGDSTTETRPVRARVRVSGCPSGKSGNRSVAGSGINDARGMHGGAFRLVPYTISCPSMHPSPMLRCRSRRISISRISSPMH